MRQTLNRYKSRLLPSQTLRAVQNRSKLPEEYCRLATIMILGTTAIGLPAPRDGASAFTPVQHLDTTTNLQFYSQEMRLRHLQVYLPAQ